MKAWFSLIRSKTMIVSFDRVSHDGQDGRDGSGGDETSGHRVHTQGESHIMQQSDDRGKSELVLEPPRDVQDDDGNGHQDGDESLLPGLGPETGAHPLGPGGRRLRPVFLAERGNDRRSPADRKALKR